MLLDKVGEGIRWGSEVKQDFHSTESVSPQWRGLTAHAKVDYLNTHNTRWDEIFNSTKEVVQFAVKSGSLLKTFNGLTFYDRWKWPDPFNHDDYLKVFNACSKLSAVCLAGKGVTDETVQAACEKCKGLSTLTLQDCDIKALPEPLPPHLTELSLFSCPSLQTFPSNLPSNLETLKIHNSNANITQLPPRLKTLEVLYSDPIHLPKVLPETLTSITLMIPQNSDQREAIIQQMEDYRSKHPQCKIAIH